MPVPTTKPLFTGLVAGAVPAVANTAADTIYLRAPFAGRITKLGVTLGSPVTGADAVCTTNINGVANPITNGVITVTPFASTAAGQTYSTVPSGAVVNEDDGIGFVFTAATAAAGGVVQVWAEIRRGSF
jgi:hypothetical protein